MANEKCELAHRTLIQAFYLDGTLAVFATGRLPAPGYEVRFERAAVPMDPPQFSVVQMRLGGIYPDAVMQYTVSRLFACNSYPRVLIVNHAGGKDTVVVVDVRSRETLEDAAPLFDAAGGAEQGVGRVPIPYVFPPSATRSSRRTGTATGYSAAFDFREALNEAVAGLPPVEEAFAEYPRTVRVVEVGIEEGGVANFHHLYVRVRRGRVARN